MKHFDACRNSSPELLELYSVPWDRLDEAAVGTHRVYEQFAHWMVHTNVIEEGSKNAGRALAAESVNPT